MSLKPGITISSTTNLTTCRIIEQPFKIPFVAAVTLVAAAILPEAGADILEDTHKSLQTYLDEGNFINLKLAIRFLGCCQGMYTEDGVFKLLSELLSKAEALKHAGNEVGVISRYEQGFFK